MLNTYVRDAEINMLISCSRCGRIHERGKCSIKIKRVYEKDRGDNGAFKYRKTADWQRVRGSVVVRDKYLCQLCIRGLHTVNTSRLYNNITIEVHHINPINEDWDLRNDESNLITLCVHHHKMADRGEIPRAELKQIVQEQIKKTSNQ